MGTTQRIKPGKPGEPNWGNLSASITFLAKTIQQKKQAELKDEVDTKDLKKMEDREKKYLRSTFDNLLKTGGGAKNVTSGGSASLGRAGLKSSGKLANFISTVGSRGLKVALEEIGIKDIEGKKLKEVINRILIYFSDKSTGMDETAANKAIAEIFEDIAEESNNNVHEFEERLSRMAKGKELSEILCKCFGYYIFEHLSQRFEEKISQEKGEAVSRETFKTIKDDVLGQVRVLNSKRSIKQINWRGAEGKVEVEKIFNSIINILCGKDEN